ncbi:unnamed protein product [Adineta steineri]|uniref:Guanylate cyclase domain-containing protein n=1 Tax=Adineta steineri TaxID=433720 RepID=A0A813N6Q5_9BILA|nr:unnamed protein product [Adineta steineri]
MKNPLGLNHAEIVAGLALELVKSSKRVINPVTKQPFRVKFGFHSGPAVGGIVGAKNYQYCLFGDTINTASRITTTGEPGRVHVSDTSYALLKDSQYFETQHRGKTELKGKGTSETYWLIGPTPAYTSLIDQDQYDMDDEEPSELSYQQATKAENNAPRSFANTSPNGHLAPVPRTPVKSNINKRPSLSGSQCPFSGHKIGIEPFGM